MPCNPDYDVSRLNELKGRIVHAICKDVVCGYVMLEPITCSDGKVLWELRLYAKGVRDRYSCCFARETPRDVIECAFKYTDAPQV